MNQIDSVIYHTHTYTHMSRLTGKTIISEKNMNNTKKFCFRQNLYGIEKDMLLSI